MSRAMQSVGVPRGTNLGWADSLRTTTTLEGSIRRQREMDSFGYFPQLDRSTLTSPLSGLDMNESLVMAAYQNHARSREPASDKLVSLQRLLDGPQLSNETSAARRRSSSTTSALSSYQTRSRPQVQEHDDCASPQIQEQDHESPTVPVFPRDGRYAPSFMEPDALVRKTTRPSSAPASRGTSAQNPVANAMRHTAQSLALPERHAQTFTVEQGLAQSVWKILGLNRRRFTEQTLKRLFHEWDADGSNGITRQEFNRAIIRLRPITSPNELKAGFEEADANKDGVIEIHEFIAWFGLNRLM